MPHATCPSKTHDDLSQKSVKESGQSTKLPSKREHVQETESGSMFQPGRHYRSHHSCKEYKSAKAEGRYWP